MNTTNFEAITEVELIKAFKNNAIETLEIHPTKPQWYCLVAKVSWIEKKCVVFNTRGSIREWANREVLLKHIENYPNVCESVIILINNSKGNNNETPVNSS